MTRGKTSLFSPDLIRLVSPLLTLPDCQAFIVCTQWLCPAEFPPPAQAGLRIKSGAALLLFIYCLSLELLSCVFSSWFLCVLWIKGMHICQDTYPLHPLPKIIAEHLIIISVIIFATALCSRTVLLSILCRRGNCVD